MVSEVLVRVQRTKTQSKNPYLPIPARGRLRAFSHEPRRGTNTLE